MHLASEPWFGNPYLSSSLLSSRAVQLSFGGLVRLSPRLWSKDGRRLYAWWPARVGAGFFQFPVSGAGDGKGATMFNAGTAHRLVSLTGLTGP